MVGTFTPYSSVKPFIQTTGLDWYPEEERERVASYVKYDEMYWNDETQFSLRVLSGEQPIYIPNARTIVDTTAHFLLKGLQIRLQDPEKEATGDKALQAFLKRECFYSRFHTAKHAGVARGDFVFHLTADPSKPAGSRLSLNSVEPGNVIPVYDDDNLDDLLRVHLIDIFVDPKDTQNPKKLRKLTYEYVMVSGQKRVRRVQALYKLNDSWFGQQPELLKVELPEALLPASITTIPIYWFQNLAWEGQIYGSSELRGFERLTQGISQAATDQEVALALEGLGVYATDGGAPVDELGRETDWEIAPGKVMEVPTGSYFRRIEGLTTLKPSMDHINYIESKFREAGGLSDVALGRVDVQTAQSGIALAIKFLPTLAKLEERDTAGIDRLVQLFFDWKTWMNEYEGVSIDMDILATIGQKLPDDRTSMLNELNNMLDREVISRQYYRTKMTELGWVFPDDIEKQIEDERTADAELAAKFAPPGLQGNAEAAASGDMPPPPGPNGSQANKKPNNANNKNRPNESAGTEAGQTPRRQARGGTSR